MRPRTRAELKFSLRKIYLPGVTTAALFTVLCLWLFTYGEQQEVLPEIPMTLGGDAVLWQVHTTFLSVGFAGLAIASQVFVENPLAIGASRNRILDYVGARHFAVVGLLANGLLALETIWLQSDWGTVAVTLLWCGPTIFLLIRSYVRMIRLLGTPSLIDEMVRHSLVSATKKRFEEASRKYDPARADLGDLLAPDVIDHSSLESGETFRVPVPAGGLVLKGVQSKRVRRSIDAIRMRQEGAYSLLSVQLLIEPGDRVKMGQSAFVIRSPKKLPAAERQILVRELLASLQYEQASTTTPDEMTEREIVQLKDAVGINIRSGSFGSARRALQLLSAVLIAVWDAPSKMQEPTRRSAYARRDWRYRSMSEVESDAALSPRAAQLFIQESMTRAIEASKGSSMEYFEESLRSFTRLWSHLLPQSDPYFQGFPGLIISNTQSLAEYAFIVNNRRDELQTRATWTLVELVKLALDAQREDLARSAAMELKGLFEFHDNEYGSRHVRAGQLVLSAWLAYLADKKDPRRPTDATWPELLKPKGAPVDILVARDAAEEATSFSRWDWWEMKTSPSGQAQVLELSHYLDLAEIDALANTRGPLPLSAGEDDYVYRYRRYAHMLGEFTRDLTPREKALKEKFDGEVQRGLKLERDALAGEALSEAKIEAIRESMGLEFAERPGLAEYCAQGVVSGDAPEKPIIGMNLLVSRGLFVDRQFNSIPGDPRELGRMIVRRVSQAEERSIVGSLTLLDSPSLELSVEKISEVIDDLGGRAGEYVLLTPFGGFIDVDAWYSREFAKRLDRVTHVETGEMAGHAILFRKGTALSCERRPEQKPGLVPAGDAPIAVGVFDDLEPEDEPKVRVEIGEYFASWVTDPASIHIFGSGEEAVSFTNT